jgi:hypothetical protein
MKPADRDYYRKLSKKSRTFSIRMDKKHWCDLYHEHFDWDGKGNASKTDRVKHLNALFRALRRTRVELSTYGRPYQLFAYIDLDNSANDALYVHTPNPNGTPFPNPIESISVVVQAPPVVAARINVAEYEVRRCTSVNERVLYVVPKGRSEA